MAEQETEELAAAKTLLQLADPGVQARKQGTTDQEVTSILMDMHTQVSVAYCAAACWLHCRNTSAHGPEDVASC